MGNRLLPRHDLMYDEHGCALCPLCPDPGDDRPAWYSECGERGLYVTWELDVPVVADDAEQCEVDYGPDSAVAGVWKVGCVSGHVLLTSRDVADQEDEETPSWHFALQMLTEGVA